MKYIITIIAIGLSLAVTLPSVPAQAQSARTFVSPTGDDSSKDCSITAPCRTFKAALAATKAGGEISVLGTADYGTLTIDRAISIANGGGFEAGIMVPFNAFGITINAGPNDAVSLRGLTLEGGGKGNASTGIQVNSAKSLTVDYCVIRHFWADGIVFSATGNLLVSNSLLADNSNNGITVYATGSGTVSAVLNRVQASNNGASGIVVWGGDNTRTIPVSVTVNDSIASGNGDAGIFVSTRAGYAPTAPGLRTWYWANWTVTGSGGNADFSWTTNGSAAGDVLQFWVPSLAAPGTGSTLNIAEAAGPANDSFGTTVKNEADGTLSKARVDELTFPTIVATPTKFERAPVFGDRSKGSINIVQGGSSTTINGSIFSNGDFSDKRIKEPDDGINIVNCSWDFENKPVLLKPLPGKLCLPSTPDCDKPFVLKPPIKRPD